MPSTLTRNRVRARPTVGVAAMGGVVLLLAVPLGTASAVQAAGSTTTMEMRNFQFAMPALELAVGDTVTWTNMDKAPHDATSTKAPVAFTSPLLQTGESWSYTLATPGTYEYFCSIHPKMTASIVATGAAPHPEAHEATAPAKQKETKATAVKSPKQAAAREAGPSEATEAKQAKAAAKAEADAKADAKKAAAAADKAAAAKTAAKVAAKASKLTSAATTAPAAPDLAVAAPATAPVAASVTSDRLDLGTAVLGGGLGLSAVVLALMLYGVRAGRRA